jgi:hypothetical protein
VHLADVLHNYYLEDGGYCLKLRPLLTGAGVDNRANGRERKGGVENARAPSTEPKASATGLAESKNDGGRRGRRRR